VSHVEPTDHDAAAPSAPAKSRHWDEVLGRALFEILIVAVGVLLALAVDEWREKAGQRELADEARSTLRAEILSNREAVISRLRRVAQLYAMTEASPERVGDFVFERRNMALLLNDSAWVMAVETGALRWLTPAERARIAEIYAGHQRMRDVVAQEMANWAELAAFPVGDLPPAMDHERQRAVRVWQAYAQRAQLAQCASIGRYERALGANVSDSALVEFCRATPPTQDPSVFYRIWERRGWVSPTRPTILREPAPPPSS
jgi:hypothetical protein